MSKIDTVRKFYAVFASGEVSGFDEILTESWELMPALFGTPGTKDGEKQSVGYLHSVLSDITYTVDDVYECNGTVVAARNTMRARQTGEFLGLSATGEAIELMTMEFHHFEGDRVAMTWHLEDFFGVYQALLKAGAKPV